MLMGFHQNSIDAKNRVIVPAKFREELGPKCILTRGLDDCLVFYPLSSWQEQQAKLAELPRSDEKVRAFLRYMYANAVECELDKQGRTVLPANLRDAVCIKNEVVLIGMLDRVEMWDKAVYDSSNNGGKLTNDDFKKFSEEYKV